MSFWQRVRQALRGEGVGDEPPAGAEPSGPQAEVEAGGGYAAHHAAAQPASSGAGTRPGRAGAVVPAGPEDVLRGMNNHPASFDEGAAVTALERLEAEGRAGSALSLAAALLLHGVQAPRLRLAMAEVYCARAQDAEALDVLAPLVSDASFDALAAQLTAEIHERRGRNAEARQLYEAILARDVGHARASSKLERLVERERAAATGGATLAAEGALSQGRYRIEQELGRGGAGTVFLARDTRLDRRVALKVYHRQGRAEWERLLVEVRTPARIEHPLVCRVLDLDAQLFAVALEYLPSGSVRTLIDRGGYDLPRALALLHSAAVGLAAVHAAGFVHRDVKPSNLLLRDDGRVVLTDFGIALPIGAAPSGAAAEGTRQYMPPEQLAAAPAQPAADVFAWGRAAAELLAPAQGSVPKPLASLLAATLRESPAARPSLAQVMAGLEDALPRG